MKCECPPFRENSVQEVTAARGVGPCTAAAAPFRFWEGFSPFRRALARMNDEVFDRRASYDSAHKNLE
jgi:hypothetical protein